MARYGPSDFYQHDGALYPALLYAYWPIGVLLDGAAQARAIKGISIPFDLAIGVVAYVAAAAAGRARSRAHRAGHLPVQPRRRCWPGPCGDRSTRPARSPTWSPCWRWPGVASDSAGALARAGHADQAAVRARAAAGGGRRDPALASDADARADQSGRRWRVRGLCLVVAAAAPGSDRVRRAGSIGAGSFKEMSLGQRGEHLGPDRRLQAIPMAVCVYIGARAAAARAWLAALLPLRWRRGPADDPGGGRFRDLRLLLPADPRPRALPVPGDGASWRRWPRRTGGSWSRTLLLTAAFTRLLLYALVGHHPVHLDGRRLDRPGHAADRPRSGSRCADRHGGDPGRAARARRPTPVPAAEEPSAPRG